MSGLLKNLLLALGLALIVWIGYTIFLKGEEEAPLTAEGGALTTDVERDTQEFLELLNQLREIDFESSLFGDPSFRSLVDYRRDLANEPVGRPNPFDPTGQ